MRLLLLLLLLLLASRPHESEAKRRRKKSDDHSSGGSPPVAASLEQQAPAAAAAAAAAADVYSEPPTDDDSRLITPRGVACRRIVSIPAAQRGRLTAVELAELTAQLEECGFVYFAPGSAVSAAWVEAAHQKVRKVWGAFQAKPELAKKYATPIPAGGKRVDIVVPPERPNEPGGAFNDTMFAAFAPALFQLLDASLEDCCSLQMMVVKNALQQTRTGNPDVDGREQTWHDDSLPGLFDQQFGVAVALHDMESGQIAVQPGCYPPEGFHHRIAAEQLAAAEAAGDAAGKAAALAAAAEHDAKLQEQPCYSSPGFAPARIEAGTVLLHRARLRHRGLWNVGPHANRYNLQLNIAPLGGWQDTFVERTAHGRGLWGEIHAHRRAGFEARVRQVLHVLQQHGEGGAGAGAGAGGDAESHRPDEL
jgi:hypothetical protein